jgi:hypothetical protein
MKLTMGVIEERVNNMIEQNSKEHEQIKSAIQAIDEKLDVAFVKKEEFTPVRNVVYGMVSLILTTTLGWILYLVASNKVL